MAKSSRKSVEQFLSAPEATVTSQREKRKLLDRKLRDEARLKRERTTKAKERPSHEDVLADVVRVAEDPEVNPFAEFRSISQRRYELYGHYPIEEVLRFGRFEHVKQQAGLATTVGTRMLLHARTEKSLRDHDARYMRRYLLPHVDKFPELTRADGKWHCGLSISDLHALYLDPFTWRVFCDVARNTQPDVIYFNGDVLDGLEISSHPKVPTAGAPLQLEIDFCKRLFQRIKEECPKSRVVWGAGNHFLDRLTRYLTQVARGMAGLRSLRVDNLLDLGDLDVELVQGGSFVSPPGQASQEPRKVLWDAYLVTHGTKLGAHPAQAELAQWGRSGTSGHVHRAAVHFGSTAVARGLTWMSTPGACVDDAGKWYVGDHTGWQRGFGIFFVSPKGRVHHYPVVTDKGWALVEGRAYEARGDEPEDERGLRDHWMREFNLKREDYI